MTTKKFPILPAHPERICWGCDKYCSIDALACGNGSERTQHPVELFGEDWLDPILPFDGEAARNEKDEKDKKEGAAGGEGAGNGD